MVSTNYPFQHRMLLVPPAVDNVRSAKGNITFHTCYPLGRLRSGCCFFSEAGSRSGVSIHACPAPLRLSCVLWHTSRQRRHLQVPLLWPRFQLSAVLWPSCLGSVSLFVCHMHWVLFYDLIPLVWYCFSCHARWAPSSSQGPMSIGLAWLFLPTALCCFGKASIAERLFCNMVRDLLRC